MSNQNEMNTGACTQKAEASFERSEKSAPLSCGEAGASFSNTAPAKYIKQEQHICPLRCAIDSLYVSYSGFLTLETESTLNYLKSIAQGKEKESKSLAKLSILDHQFEVLPKGSNKMSFVLVDNWFRIELSARKSKKLPLAYVQISSELLTSKSVENILAKLDLIIHSLGSPSGSARISRVDLCMDFFCKGEFDFAKVISDDFKTKAEFINAYYLNKRLSGFVIGKGDVSCRIYNKLEEIKKSGKEYLKDLWKQKGWLYPSPVWRVEFQFRREFLQQVSIYHLEQLLNNRENLWKYATVGWLELVVPNEDSNPSRWPMHPAWLEITQSCNQHDAPSVQRVPKERLPSDESLFINGLSAITSFMAREGISEVDEAFGEFWTKAERFHAEKRGTPMKEYLNKKAAEKAKRFNKVREEV